MEPFNLDTWLKDKSRKVVTRQGKSVRIICTDRKHTDSWPIVALEDYGDGEFAIYANIDGRTDMGSENIHDLFFADEEEELTEFEKSVQYVLGCYTCKQIEFGDRADNIKFYAETLLDLARKEIEKSNPYNGKQKQEWSEEDEKKWLQVINEIEAIKSNSSTIFEKNIAQDKIDWLKSLKDRVQSQPNQEWSEKDKHILKNIYDFVKENIIDPHRMNCAEECLNWLKSIKPQPKYQWTDEDEKNLKDLLAYGETKLGLRRWIAGLPEKLGSRPEYHWKPSEEQMQALFEAKLASIKNREYFLGLLYEDLKKL